MSGRVQRKAPDFQASAVLPDGTIQEDFSSEALRGSYALLFFYPFDFSFVCPTEILALNERMEEFQARDCRVVGISVDSQYAHLAWTRTSEEDGGIGSLRFPLVSDLKKEISQAYGVLGEEGVSLRASFLLDRSGIVRHATINDLNLGRNVSEILRTLDAVRHIDETGDLCPADWDKSKKALAAPGGIVKMARTFDLTPS